MTDNYLPASTPPQRGESLPPGLAEEQGTTDVVKDQASDLSHSSVQAGKHVAEVAREQASDVAAEAGRQGRDLLQQAQDQLGEQAAQGQQGLAKQLLSLSNELRTMADASGRGGMAAGLAHQAASRVRDAGQWLDNRNPGQVADEMQSFARRRPAVFLALAAGAGLVAGRLTRGLKDATSENSAAAAGPAATQEIGRQRAQPPHLASYPPSTGAGASGQTAGLFAPASGLPLPTGGDPAWEAGPGHGERSPLVPDDQTGRQGPL
jgi:polyhydroxyalkanoate synthesis regulator phasin